MCRHHQCPQLEYVSIFSLLTLTRSSSCSLKTTDIQEKLDFEIRMREGAYKLLLACSKRQQVLDASKNLLTCNARIKAYLAQLQKKSEEQDPVSAERLACAATIAISGESTPPWFENRNQMFQMNISVFLMQACVFRWCGGIQTTSTTEEVSFFPSCGRYSCMDYSK